MMDTLLAARMQMAVSLGFHILFSVAGMAMPTLMVVAEALHIRTKNPVYLDLAHRWARGTAILFAVGAVSGTVLSFELGLLWPKFMAIAGPSVGIAFTLEGFAFFLEGIFLGIYLYGWERLSRRWHAVAGCLVAASGLAGGAFVLSVNGFMNTPQGMGPPVDVLAAFLNPAFGTEVLHMTLAAYTSVAVVVLGIHASRLRINPESSLHQAAVKIAMAMAIVVVPLLLLSGDLSAKHIAKHQPLKLAAAESLFHTERGAPLTIGGLPDLDRQEVLFGLPLPKMLSVLAFADPDAEVKGLDAFDRELWPPVVVVHLAFQLMVGAGMAMLLLVAIGAWLWWRKKHPFHPRFLKLATWAAPLGLIAVEAGWTVTEVGRQPWIIHGVLLTRDAVTTVDGLWVHFIFFSALYAFLGTVVVLLLKAHVLATDATGAASARDGGAAEAES